MRSAVRVPCCSRRGCEVCAGVGYTVEIRGERTRPAPVVKELKPGWGVRYTRKTVIAPLDEPARDLLARHRAALSDRELAARLGCSYTLVQYAATGRGISASSRKHLEAGIALLGEPGPARTVRQKQADATRSRWTGARCLDAAERKALRELMGDVAPTVWARTSGLSAPTIHKALRGESLAVESLARVRAILATGTAAWAFSSSPHAPAAARGEGRGEK